MQQQRAHFTSISMQGASLPLCIIEVWGQQGQWVKSEWARTELRAHCSAECCLYTCCSAFPQC